MSVKTPTNQPLSLFKIFKGVVTLLKECMCRKNTFNENGWVSFDRPLCIINKTNFTFLFVESITGLGITSHMRALIFAIISSLNKHMP